MKKIIRLIQCVVIFHIITSTDCHGFPQQNYNENTIALKINNSIPYHVNDTIWVDAWVSRKVYNLETQDSVLINSQKPLIIGLYKLASGNTSFNVKYADNITKITSANTFNSMGNSCTINPSSFNGIISPDKRMERFKVGIIPKDPGDYLISFNDNVMMKDVNTQHQILQNYPVSGDKQLVWEPCNGSSISGNVAYYDVFVKVQ